MKTVCKLCNHANELHIQKTVKQSNGSTKYITICVERVGSFNGHDINCCCGNDRLQKRYEAMFD